MFSVAYFLCFVVSIFSFAAYRGTCEIVPPLKNFALLYCLLAMGIELSTLILTAIFKVDYKKALYAAVVFSKASPTFLTVLCLLGVIVYLLALLLWACGTSQQDDSVFSLTMRRPPDQP